MRDEYLTRMDRLLDKHEQRTRLLTHTVNEIKQRVALLAEEIEYLRSQSEEDRAELSKEREKLRGMRKDPVVLVRKYGSYRHVYHSATRPCGWAGRTENYERLLLGEAKERGKRACDSCGYRVRMEAEAA